MQSLKMREFEEDIILFNEEESDLMCQLPGGLVFSLGILQLENGMTELKNSIARELKQNSNWFLNSAFGLDWINVKTNEGILDRRIADINQIRNEIDRIIRKYTQVSKIDLLEIFLQNTGSLMIGLRLIVDSEQLELGVIIE